MNGRRRLAAVLAMLLLGAVACTSDRPAEGKAPPSIVPPSPEVVSPGPDGPGSAAAALAELCTIPEPKVNGDPGVPAEGPTPPAIAAVMEELEQVRGFGFASRVVADPVTQDELAAGYLEYFDEAYPEDYYERRSVAWRTIGVIPDNVEIREALENYISTQVIGYYDTLTGELVFIGTHDPTPLERITLAHELTHAIDDQRFGLEKLDLLGAACADEALEAGVAVVEGSATFFSLRWAQTFLTAEEVVRVGEEIATQEVSTAGVPRFIQALQLWPYDEGLRFVTALRSRGGLEAIDAALADLPVSTEQIIHPERYPNDVPTPLDVTDLGPDLGRRWKDLDVMHVGEAWLSVAFQLRLDATESAEAAAGWDGGLYRAWTDGRGVAIVLATAWDSEDDAEGFARSMQRWIEAGDQAAVVLPREAERVRVLFASDGGTLEALEAAAA